MSPDSARFARRGCNAMKKVPLRGPRKAQISNSGVVQGGNARRVICQHERLRGGGRQSRVARTPAAMRRREDGFPTVARSGREAHLRGFAAMVSNLRLNKERRMVDQTGIVPAGGCEAFAA